MKLQMHLNPYLNLPPLGQVLGAGLGIFCFWLEEEEEVPNVCCWAWLEQCPSDVFDLTRNFLVGLAFVLTVGKPTVSALQLHCARWSSGRCLRAGDA